MKAKLTGMETSCYILFQTTIELTFFNDDKRYSLPSNITTSRKENLHTPNANMADLSAGPGLVAGKRG